MALTERQRGFDEGYVLGIFNTCGIEGLLEELKRLKKIGYEPHQILDLITKNNKDG